jgi:hypothetical protein
MVLEVNFPPQTQLNGKEEESYYRDAFLVNSKRGNLAAKYVYHSVFAHFPNFIVSLYKLRNRFAKRLRFSERSYPTYFSYNDIYQGRKIGPVTFDQISVSELIVVAYEKNMDIWVSVLKVADRRFVISTLINFKTQRGRLYMRCIKPLHQMVTKFCIKQAVKAGRL